MIKIDRVGVEPKTSVQTIVVKIKVQSYSKVVVGIANGLRKKFGNVVNIAPITLLLSEQETKNGSQLTMLTFLNTFLHAVT